MKHIIAVIVFLFIATFVLDAQERSMAKAEFKAFGNCGLCKARIEKALKIKEVQSATWNKKTGMVSVAYDASAITLDSLQQRVAAVGHDTEKYKATDSVYTELPGCCQYRLSSSDH